MNTAINIEPDLESELRMSTKTEYHDTFDKKFDIIFDTIDVQRFSLFEIINKIKALPFSVDTDLVRIIIQKKLDHIVGHPPCPKCGASLHRKHTQQKELITTLGPINLACPYFVCRKCKTNHQPYEHMLNLRDGKYQYDVQKIAMQLASDITYDKSADMLNEIYRFGIASDTVHRLTEQVASTIQLTEIIPSADEIRKVVDKIAAGQRRRPVFVFAADGAMVPIRTEQKGPHAWKEAKGIRAYLLDKDHLVHLFSWHQIRDKAGFSQCLDFIKTQGLIPLDKVRLCCIGDGASWIWDTVRSFFPDCRQVLDYFHCAQHLHEFAQSYFGQNSQAKQWVEETKARLFHNNTKGVFISLGKLRAQTQDKRLCDRLINYLKCHSARIEYGKFRRGGYPLGSGAIESANKFICHVRLKRSGAWWKLDNANNVLSLRCAIYNEKFDEVFNRYETEKQQLPPQRTTVLKRVK